jgi:peroxiredoxin Q/BCP
MKTVIKLLLLATGLTSVVLGTSCLRRVPEGSGSTDEKGSERDPSKMLAVGTPAPDFSVLDDSGRLVEWSSLKGKTAVVLILYPGDETPGCTKQLCSARDDWKEYAALGIEVYGVNPADAASHRKFRESHDFPFPLLADTEGAMIRAYGARGALGITQRTVYGIDKKGLIVFAERGMPKTEAILAAFR